MITQEMFNAHDSAVMMVWILSSLAIIVAITLFDRIK